MKTSKLLIFVITLLVLTTSAYAQTQAEQLKQMVAQLQKTPTDTALREKIIKLAPTLKPAPAVSDEAIRFEGRGQFAFANAKSEDDYLAAAKEYEKAITVAPWVQGYYSDLCTIYEKAGKFEDAKRHCGYYLIGLTDPTQITEVKRRIAGLEFGIEKSAPAAQAQRERQAFREFLKTLDGKVFYEQWRTYANGARSRMKVKIRGEQMAIGSDFINEKGVNHNEGFALGEQFSYEQPTVIPIDSSDPALEEENCLL